MDTFSDKVSYATLPAKGCTNPKEVMKMLINGTEDLRVQKTIDAIQKNV